jgi:hypothetical protein
MPTQDSALFTVREFLLTTGLAVLAGVSVSNASAAEVTLDPTTRDFKLPDQIPWSKPGQSGTQTANLVGNQSKPGFYIQMLKRPPNNWSGPHMHDHDRFIVVLEGTMWAGTGDSFDKEKTVGLPKGSFMTDFAGKTHYDGSKAEGLTIMISGIVPPKA